MEVLISFDHNRPVEWLAVYAIIFGHVPSSAYKRSYAAPASAYKNPRKSNELVRINAWDGYLYRPIMKTCCECGQDFPEDSECWPRNRDGRNGFYSKCRACKQDADNKRYRRRVSRLG